MKNFREAGLRAPIRWLRAIACPTYVFEGADPEKNNIACLNLLREANTNAKVEFHSIPGATHFTLIVPWIEFTAGQIVADTGTAASFDFRGVTTLMRANRNP